MFGAEVWWPGNTIISWNKGKYKELRHRSGSHIALLTKTINLGLRAILPVHKTIPVPALYREAGILPASLLLEGIRFRQALRIQTLDDKHPLKKRAFDKRVTRLTKRVKLLPVSVDSKNIS